MIQSSSQKEIPAGMIDLGIGQPSPGLLPVAALVEAASHCAGRPGGILLSYGAEQGDPGFRTALAGFLADVYGAGIDPAQLLITNGASQAIDLICTLYSRPGDTILVDYNEETKEILLIRAEGEQETPEPAVEVSI